MAGVKEAINASYPAAVVRRFFELELLDKSFGLAAQAFVSMLPLLIVVVSVVLRTDGEVLAVQLSERFGLAGAADEAVRTLFRSPSVVVSISWLAVVMSLLSAFALSRRLSRVYASIFGLPSLSRSQLWRGVVWILLQIALFAAASQLRGIRRDSGPILAAVALVALLLVWFLGDVAGLRLLVPSLPRRLLIPSGVVSGVARVALSVWAALYMPGTLSGQAEQYGPIGVTFSLFTLILVGVVVYLVPPLMVSVWVQRRAVA